MDNALILEILANLANLIYVLGFAIKKMHWLRVMMIAGAVMEIIYFLFVAESPIWSYIFWCGIWIFVNGFQLAIYLNDKLNFKMTPEETRVYQMVFHPLAISDFKKILNLASWKTISPKEQIVKEKTEIDNLFLIFTGVAEVDANGQRVAYIRDGNFIGEMSLISGGKTTANVSALTEIKMLVWNREELKKLMDKSKEIEDGLKSVFNLDFVKKLSAEKEN